MLSLVDVNFAAKGFRLGDIIEDQFKTSVSKYFGKTKQNRIPCYVFAVFDRGIDMSQ